MYELNKKGFTLIELLIVIAILGIVTSVIGSFFISNYKANNYVKDELALQDEGEKAINFMTEKCMDGSKIYIINSNNVEKTNITAPITINNMCIQTIDEKALFFRIENNKLYYGEGKIQDNIEEKANIEKCNNIKSLTIKSIPISALYKECLGIRFEIEVGTEKMSKIFKSEVYFRNK